MFKFTFMTCHVKIKWSTYRRNCLTFHKGASTQRNSKKGKKPSSSPLIQFILPSCTRTSYISRTTPIKPPPHFECSPTSLEPPWPRERLINVANGQMEFWTIKDGQVGEGVGREKGWKFLSLSLMGAGAAVEVVAASPRKNRRTKGKFRMLGTYLLSRRHVIRLWNGRRRMNQKETRSLNYRVWSS